MLKLLSAGARIWDGDLIPIDDDGNPVDLATGVSPGGRPIDESPLGKPGGKKNYVAKRGGLPPYIRGVARGIDPANPDSPHAISEAIAAIKRWAATSKNAAVKAAAIEALAQWEKLKSGGHDLANEVQGYIDLDWAALDAARGLHPRVKAPPAAPPAAGGPAVTPAQQAAADKANMQIALTPAVVAAIKKYQADEGLPTTGKLDPATVESAQTYGDRASATAAAKKAASAAKTAASKQAAAEKKAAAAQKSAAAKQTATNKKASSAKTAALKKSAAAALKSQKAQAATLKAHKAAEAKVAKAAASAAKAASAKATAAQKAKAKSDAAAAKLALTNVRKAQAAALAKTKANAATTLAASKSAQIVANSTAATATTTATTASAAADPVYVGGTKIVNGKVIKIAPPGSNVA